MKGDAQSDGRSAESPRPMRPVKKRDGREVPFDQNKIADAIYRAARSVGGGDRFLAEELASVVTLFIEREWQDRTPSIEDVSDLIERVLVETGHTKTAKAFILERDRRARLRAQLRVRDDRPRPTDGAGGPTVDALAHHTVSPWSKGKIAEALVVEADLPPAVAAEIAGDVERRVFASGLTRVSTTLLRALVDNELFERGYQRMIDRQAVIGMPRYDLDRLVRSGADGDGRSPGTAAAADRDVAATSWTRYSLLTIYPDTAVAAHLNGQIHVHGLRAPTRFHSIEVDIGADAELASKCERGLDALRWFVERTTDLVDRQLVLRGAEIVLVNRLAARGVDCAAVAREFLAALARPLECDGDGAARVVRLGLAPSVRARDALVARGLDAETATARFGSFVVELLRARTVLASELSLPRVVIDLAAAADDEKADFSAILDAAVLGEGASGDVEFTIDPRIAGQRARFAPVLARVEVDVAQAAFRAPRFDAAAVAEQVAAAVALAAEACEARIRFFQSLPGHAAPRERLRRVARGTLDALSAGRAEIGLGALGAASRIALDQPLDHDERTREFGRVVVAAARRAVAEQAESRRIALGLAFTSDADVLARFGRIGFERWPRGRDVHGVPHDGRRYRYSAALAPPNSGHSIERAALLESELRRAGVIGAFPRSDDGLDPLTSEERARFVMRLAQFLRRDDPECS